MFIIADKKHLLPLSIAVLSLVAVVTLCFAGIVEKKCSRSDCIAVDIEKYNFANSKASLFKEAIDEFGAISPEAAALLWAKGVMKRNGALQYAVMDEELKKKYANKMEKERPSWVTGFSSPWVEKFEIIRAEKVSETAWSFTVRFDMVTSTGSAGSHYATLLIERQGGYWVIRSALMDEFLKGLTGFP